MAKSRRNQRSATPAPGSRGTGFYRFGEHCGIVDSYCAREEGVDTYAPQPEQQPVIIDVDNYQSRRAAKRAANSGDSHRSGESTFPVVNSNHPTFPQSGHVANGGDNHRLAEFSFRAANPSQSSFSQAPPAAPRAQRGKQTQKSGRGRGRGGFKRPPVSQRALLFHQRQSTPERLPGMGTTSSKYDAIELDMHRDSQTAMTVDATEKNTEEPPSKRRHVKQSGVSDTGKPGWSNPDPYSVLPPTDEQAGKRPDFVQLIRQARKSDSGQTDAAGEGSDFIQFGSETISDANDGVQVGTGSYHGGRRSSQPQGLGLPYRDDKQFTTRDKNTPVSSHQIKGTANKPAQALKVDHAAESHPSGTSINQTHRPGPPQSGPSMNQTQGPGPSHTPQASQAQTSNQWPRSNVPVLNSNHWLPPSGQSLLGQSKQPRPQQPPDRGKKRAHDNISQRDPYQVAANANAHDPLLLPKWASGIDRPWLDHIPDLPLMSDKMWQLHIEIVEFYSGYLRPRGYERAMRQNVIDRLQLFFDKHYPGCIATPFGSFAADIFLPTADMDIVIMTGDYQMHGLQVFGKSPGQKPLQGVVKRFRNYSLHRGAVLPLYGARVPLVKYVDRVTDLRVDMSFENRSGINTNRTYQVWFARYPELQPIVTLIKLYLNMRELDDPSQGGIGGFTVTCMAAYVLHNWDSVGRSQSQPSDNLGMVLLQFFDFFGSNNLFDARTQEINARTMTIDTKVTNSSHISRKQTNDPQIHASPELVVRDPDVPDNNIAKASKDASMILRAFKDASKRLKNRLNEATALHKQNKLASVLDVLYTGNYRWFDDQRSHLASLAKGL